MRTIRIGTRKSRLACIQAEMAAEYINHYCQGCDTQLVQLVTTGDRLLTTPLDQIGTKGVFVRELDAALRDGVTDLSVHSLKDMPSDIDADLPIIGYSLREDARDVLVLPVRGFRIHAGDVALIVPAQSPVDGAVMLIEHRS